MSTETKRGEATARPWRYRDGDLFAADKYIGRMHGVGPSGVDTLEETASNVTLVVRAVNTFDKARGALREVCRSLAYAVDALQAPERSAIRENLETARAVLDEMDAASEGKGEE